MLMEKWKLEVEKYDAEDICRSEEIQGDTVFLFVTEIAYNGPCCMEAGIWRWSNDIRLLATFLLEHELRVAAAYICDAEELNGFETPCIEYCQKLVNAGITDARKFLALAKKIQTVINKGECSIKDLKSITAKLEAISRNESFQIRIQLCETEDAASALLIKHERNRFENNESIPWEDRYYIDYTAG